MNAILPFIIEHWAAISAIIAAIGLRLFPTEKNYDVFHKVLRLLDLIIPNIKKGGGRHAAKIILFFALASVSAGCYAQLNTTTRLVKFRSGVQNAIDTAEANGNEGNIWYDFVTGRYRANEGGTNKFLIGGSGGEFWPLAGSALITDDVTIFGGANVVTLGSLTPFSEFYITSSLISGFTTTDGSGNHADLVLNAGEFSLTANNSTGVFMDGDGLHLQNSAGDIRIDAPNDNIIFDNPALTYFTATNQLHWLNTSGQFSTDVFGGEIQIDDIVNSKDVTLSNTGLFATGYVATGGNFTLSCDNVLKVESPVGIDFNGNGFLQFEEVAELAQSTDKLLYLDAVDNTLQYRNFQLTGGVYNPVGTNVSNASSILPVNGAVYTRIGSNVTVSGLVTVTSTAVTETVFTLSLPISSDLEGTVDCVGTFSGREQDGSPTTQMPGSIIADITNNTARFNFLPLTSGAGGTTTFSFMFQYIVK